MTYRFLHLFLSRANNSPPRRRPSDSRRRGVLTRRWTAGPARRRESPSPRQWTPRSGSRSATWTSTPGVSAAVSWPRTPCTRQQEGWNRGEKVRMRIKGTWLLPVLLNRIRRIHNKLVSWIRIRNSFIMDPVPDPYYLSKMMWRIFWKKVSIL